jgi:glycosyltransferase involved in cell wall biosynthesis
MADAISAVRNLSSENCRAYAREHFSAERMTNRYLALYEQLVARANLPAAA